MTCSTCGGLLPLESTMYSIDPKALLDPPLFQQLQIVHPRYLQLLFSKLNLTEDQLLAQQGLSLSQHFPTFPMVEYFEVIATTQVGVMIGTGSFVSKLLKSCATPPVSFPIDSSLSM